MSSSFKNVIVCLFVYVGESHHWCLFLYIPHLILTLITKKHYHNIYK